jgi:hypothetical protein
MSEKLTLQDSVADKVHPRRFPRMSGKMAAILGHLLNQTWTDPAMVELVITSDGFLMGRHEGEVTCNRFLGEESSLRDNLKKLITLPEVGLTGEEKEYLMKLFSRIRRLKEKKPARVLH